LLLSTAWNSLPIHEVPLGTCVSSKEKATGWGGEVGVPMSTPIPPAPLFTYWFSSAIVPDVLLSQYISNSDSTGFVSNTFKLVENGLDPEVFY